MTDLHRASQLREETWASKCRLGNRDTHMGAQEEGLGGKQGRRAGSGYFLGDWEGSLEQAEHSDGQEDPRRAAAHSLGSSSRTVSSEPCREAEGELRTAHLTVVFMSRKQGDRFGKGGTKDAQSHVFEG